MRIFGRLATYCFILALSDEAVPLPIKKRHADFHNVRTHLDWDYSNSDEKEPNKYFHESSFSQHYDGRFADKQLEYEDRRKHLTTMVRMYLSAMNDIGVETWIMHGSLLGWWWNRMILPWDSDLDVMVSEKSIHHLADYYNMTVYDYEVPGTEEIRYYMLEINPHYANRSLDDTNKIDARWIDTDTGMFIDITTLRRNKTAETLGIEGAMSVKDRHHYLYDDIYPLRESVFEGSAVKVPYAYADLLIEEYGEKALSDVFFESHRFDTVKQEWIALRWADPYVRGFGPSLGMSYWGKKITEFWAL